MAKKNEKALAKNEKRADAMTAGFGSVDLGFRKLAEAFSTALTVPQLGVAFRKLNEWTEDVKALREGARLQIIELLKKEGMQDADSTRRTLRAGELILAMRAHRTGYDPKKVEQLIRSKGYKPDLYMDAKVTFTVNEGKMDSAIKAGNFTPDELEACHYGESWTVENPSKVGDDE